MRKCRVSPELLAAVVTSVALHAVWLAREAKASFAHETKPAEVLLEAELARPAPEPKEEPKPESPEVDVPEPAPRHSAPHRAAESKPAAAPVAAQAGQTLTAPENDGAQPDVADFTMIQGSATAYAGGTTSATGTSTKAVRGPASNEPAAAPAAPAAAPAVVGPDRSRGARPASADWNCSRLFPSDPEAGDNATVLIAVTVSPNGAPRSVSVLRDPGHGFGAAAKACAMAQRYTPAADRGGSPITATTPPITVRFLR